MIKKIFYGGLLLAHLFCTNLRTLSEENYQRWERIVLEQAKGKKMIMFGEKHSDPKDYQLAYLLLPQLKELGFNYFAVEVPKDKKGEIKDYLEGKLSEEEAKKEIIGPPFDKTDNFLEMISLAHQLGMEILFYDGLVTDSFEKISLGDLSYKDYHTLRDELAFKEVKKLLERNPEAKIIFYAGANHLGEKEKVGFVSLGSLLKEYFPNKTYTINLTDKKVGADLEL